MVRAIVSTAFVVSLATAAAGAQRSAARDRSTCSPDTCEVRLERTARVTDPGSANLLPVYSIFVVEASGRFLLSTTTRNQIAAFDTTGRVVRHGTDKPGTRVLSGIVAAPSEAGAGPMAFVFDALSSALLGISTDGVITPLATFPGSPAFALANGQFVVAQQVRSARLAGHPVHVVDSTGKVLRSFGLDVPEFRTDMQRVTTRLATPGRNNTIWTVAPGRYVFEQWNPDTGERQRRTTVQSSWFVESLRDSDNWSVRPTDVIEGAWETDGMLWALIRVADSKWTSTMAPPATERALDPDDYDRRFDSILEAIDAETGRVLASRRFDRIHWGRASASSLLATRIDDGKTPGIDVWRFRLQPRSGR